MPTTFNERLLRTMDMLLLIVVALLDFASSYKTEDMCYGGNYEVPIYYTPPLFTSSIYYKPRGKQKVLAVSDGKSMLKRFSVGTGRIILQELTERDDRAMIYFGQRDSVKLNIEDCQDKQKLYYGELFSWRIDYTTEYIEFSQMTSSGNALEPIVIWNRTDASSGTRGTVKRGYFELNRVKQRDSGYYKCLTPTGRLTKWTRLEVKEHYRDEVVGQGENLEMDFPVKFSDLPQILFISRDSGYEQEIDYQYMDHRKQVTDRYFSFMNVKEEDAGTYKFIDNEGFLALQLDIDVQYLGFPDWVYVVGVIVIIVLFLVCCCCCVKKCCCKKSSNKRSSTQTDAPHVFYHDSNQPTQPVAPLLSREPRVIHADPPTYNSAAGNMDLPPPTQITVPGGLERTSTPVFPASTDSDPRFEFKGAVFPSAPPLGSGTDIQDVYTSDKLNFL